MVGWLQRGNTALLNASVRGHSDIVKLLIRSGADIRAVAKVGVHVKFLNLLVVMEYIAAERAGLHSYLPSQWSSRDDEAARRSLCCQAESVVEPSARW